MEALDKFKVFWEAPKNRYLLIGAFFVVFGYPIFSSLFGPTKKLKVFEEKPKQVIEPLFNSKTFELMDKEDVKETWDAARAEIRMEKAQFQSREEAYEKRMKELEQEADEGAMRIAKLEGMLNQLLRVKGGKNMPIINPNGMSAPNNLPANVVQDPQIERAVQNGTYVPAQNVQVLANPMFNGDVVRTITQNKMIEVKSAGAVTETDLQAKTITERKEGKTTKKSNQQLAKQKKEKDMSVFLPAGSLISGTLISGVDAPTQLSKNMAQVPVLMRVKKEAILPNFFSLDIRECRIIGSAIGNLSSKRVEIRSELISCVREDGQAIEVNLDGYAVSSFDGKAGVKGRVVQKNGDMILASIQAGFLQGFSQMVAPRRVGVISTDPQSDPFQTIDFGNAAKSGALKGVGSAMERVADYYIKLAEETFPVIELNPGIEIDFIIKRGVKLQLK